GGASVAPTMIQDVSLTPAGKPNPHNVFRVTFPALTPDGAYTFSIGPNVTDLVGNPMDQNQNTVNGENPGDVFTFQIAVNSTDDGRFVTGLYNDLLARPADTSGFLGFLAPIDAARFSLLPGVANAYILTSTVRQQLIADLYQ